MNNIKSFQTFQILKRNKLKQENSIVNKLLSLEICNRKKSYLNH